MSTKKSFLLRIDPTVFTEVERLAQGELRSVNAQVEFLLALEPQPKEAAQVKVRREVDYLGEVDAIATEGRRRLAIRRAADEAAREIVERLETP